MKKILIIIYFFSLWTSISKASTNKSLNLIVNSELIDANFSTIEYKDYILVPIKEFFNNINLQYHITNFDEENLAIKFENTTLELYSNSDTIYINGQKANLIVPAIQQNNKFYISLNLINDLTKFHIHYDKISNSIFVTSKNNLRKINFFFNKVEKILKNYNIIKIDVINEIIAADKSSYSIGNNIYIDKTLNKVFQKNILDDNWKETNIEISPALTTNFNNAFFAGISVDKINSNNDYIIFTGYYPLDNNRICHSTLYVNPHTLEIEKQISNFEFESSTVKQTVFYSYK